MPASNLTPFPAVGADPAADLRVDCYVRSTVPGPIATTIETVVDRLQRLSDRDRIAGYEITLWPPDHDQIAEASETRMQTREELVGEFERWADRHGYSLAPAFRRETTPSSPLGLGSGDPNERVRVPLVALAIYEVDSQADADRETGSLCGIVPRTNPHSERTHTVDDWLSAIELGEARARSIWSDEVTAIDGQQ